MGMLPALNKDAIGRRFRRADWTEGHAFTLNGKEWRYTSSHTHSTCLTHGNQIEADWYEMDSYSIRIDDLTIRSEEEETRTDIEKMLESCPRITKIRLFDHVLTEEEIQKLYKDKKERNMPEEAVATFKDLGKRKKYTGELYGPDGEGKAILSFDTKSDAKQVLADPKNLGCYIVLRKEVAVYTTAVPVIKAKV